MPGAQHRPSFLILRNRLPEECVHLMLGRLVTDMHRPLDSFTPQDPRVHIEIEPVVVEDLDANLVVSSAKGGTLKALLWNLLSVDLATGVSHTSTFESTSIKTYRLQNQLAAFDKLITSPAVRQTIEGSKGLLMRNKGVLYMVVGMKTCFNTTVTTEEEVHRKQGGGVTVPLSLAFGVPIVPDVGLEGSVSQQRGLTLRSLSPGEQIFAVEYRKVTQLSVFQRPDPEKEPQIANKVQVFPWEHSTFGSEYEDASFEDDNQQEPDSDMMSDQDEEIYHLEDPEWHATDFILES